MKIEKIHIKNFKGIEDSIFELNPQFTVFIGENAKGKTTILDALSIAIGSFFLGVDVAQQRGVRRDEIRRKLINEETRPQLPVVIQAIGKINNQDLSWSREVVKFSKTLTTTTQGANDLIKMASNLVSQYRKDGKVIFPVIAYHGTGRLWAEHESVSYKKYDEGIEMAYKNCLSPKSSSREFLSWYKTFEDEINKFGNEKEVVLLDAFKQAILNMIPQGAWTDMAYSFKEDELIGIFTNAEGKKERLQYKQLSDGYRNLIGMIADIAYRCIKLNPHLGVDVIKETPGVVLIDEIDLHIHPQWQKRLVDDLKRTFPNIQFIATTHSPFIVQSLKADELYNLDRKVENDPKTYPISDISTYIMGVESEFSIENQSKYSEAKEILEQIYSSKNSSNIDDRINKVSDPATRAFLELNKIANNGK